MTGILPHTNGNAGRQPIKPRRPVLLTGEEIGQQLLKKFLERNPGADKDDLRWQMFSEVVVRNAFDTAGNSYDHSPDGTLISAFDTIFAKLAEQGIAGREAFELVLAALPSYTKGFVQTPHPTEVLSNEAINAEQKFHLELEHHPRLFSSMYDQAPIKDIPESILDAMKEFYAALSPVSEPLQIRDEMRRSRIFSRRMFDAVPLVVQAMLDASKRAGAYDGSPLDNESLRHFNFIVQPCTWSPGDRDSKPLMTAQTLQEGIEHSQRAMLLLYIEQLADIIADPDTRSRDTKGNPVKSQLADVMWKTMKFFRHEQEEGRIRSDKDYVQQLINGLRKRKNLSPEAIAEIQVMHDSIGFPKSVTAREKSFESAQIEAAREKLRKEGVHVDEEYYRRLSDFFMDLESLRAADHAGEHIYPRYVFPDGRASDLSKLDMLCIQANNFGHTALHAQIRENAEMHSKVMQMVLQTLTKRGLVIEGYTPEKYNRDVPREDKAEYEKQLQYKRYVVRTLLDKLLSDNIAYVNDPASGKRISEREFIHQTLAGLVEAMEQENEKGESAIGAVKKRIEQANRERRPVDRADSNQNDFYETLKGFQIAAKNPQSITHYIVAECGSDVDMLEAFFMLSAMEDDKTRGKYDRPKVELVPLLEHRADVESASDLMRQLYKDPYFKRHHDSLTMRGDPAVQRLNQGDKPPEYISVAEVKRMYGLKIREGDEDKPVKVTKMVMFAGSDITKDVGPGGAALVMRQTNRLREALLDMDDPVLLITYTGAGGGLHRSQPVASAYETVQGRSMRQSENSVATKILITLGHYLKKALHIKPPEFTREERLVTAQLNLGNLAGLEFLHAYNGHQMLSQLHDQALSRSLDNYQQLYKSDEYKAYLGYSADVFAKLTSFAARGAARTRSRGDDGTFPPLVDVKDLRAIGYGSALNASGSCASLYFGMGDYLRLDEKGNFASNRTLKEFVELYLNDPCAQDTINRATYGVIMANLDTAWKYFGVERKVQEDGEVTLVAPGVDPISVAHLARGEQTLQNPPSADNMKQVAMQVLACIDVEYQRVARGLVELQREAARQAGKYKYQSANDDQPVWQQLLSMLPRALGEQLEVSRQHVDPCREKLAELFNRMVEEGFSMDDAARKKTYAQAAYFPMGTVAECFENAPRAYLRTRWAAARENEASKNLGNAI